MLEELFLEINNRYDSNIYVHQCGQEICIPGHAFGPCVRDHYLIHFIISGKGTYYHCDKSYHLKKNDLFLISPGDVTFYEADKEDPWHYVWVGFNGIKATQYLDLIGLNRDNPILTTKNPDYIETCLHSIFESSKIIRGGEVRMLGNLYLFLSKLIEETKPAQQSNEKDDYIQKAITFIEMNYSRQITIQEIANHICLNRSYFSDLFKQHLGISPQQFIIKYRINKAREMIKQHQYLSIGNIARSIGYADQFAFSKTFRKETGLSPSALRKQLLEKGN